jgi:hypothetical protein
MHKEARFPSCHIQNCKKIFSSSRYLSSNIANIFDLECSSSTCIPAIKVLFMPLRGHLLTLYVCSLYYAYLVDSIKRHHIMYLYRNGGEQVE